jgi:hypothetical protein
LIEWKLFIIDAKRRGKELNEEEEEKTTRDETKKTIL